jgi:hypothetical protein
MRVITQTDERNHGVNAENLAQKINAVVNKLKQENQDISHIEVNPAELRALVTHGLARWERTNYYYNGMALWIVAFSQ